MVLPDKTLNRFVVRYAVRKEFKNAKGETEVAILLTEKKTYVCQKDAFKFYAKIGGLLNLSDLTTEKVKELLPKVDSFGNYLVFGKYRVTDGPNTFAFVVPQPKDSPFTQLVSPLVSFIPRIDGRNGKVICALKINSLGDKNHNRQWSRYVGSNRSNSNAFYELPLGYDYNKDLKQKSTARYIGLYVTANTSLIVYDMGSTDPKKVLTPDQNHTLIQEGGFVYSDADLVFRLYDQNENKLLTATELYEQFKDETKPPLLLGADKYKKNHFIREEKEAKTRSVIIFLKTSASLLPYELFVTEDVSKNPPLKGKRLLVLCLPTGAQFEYSEYWSLPEGLKSVQTRQSKKPWTKYLQAPGDATNDIFEEKIHDLVFAQSYPIEQRNQKTPQNDDLYKKLRRGRKSGPVPTTTKEEPKDESKDESKDKSKDTSKEASKEPQTEETPKDDANSGQPAADTTSSKDSSQTTE